MSVVIHVPDDIIEEILGFLNRETDYTTLRACALTSRVFLYPSQKLLFSTVYLSSYQRVRKLHTVCVSNTAIPSFIRVLHLTILGPEADGDGTLPAVLGMLMHLQSLVLGSLGSPVSWNSFPALLCASLEGLLNLPSLHAVTLRNITLVDFPSNLTHAQVLTLMDVQFIHNKRPTVGPHAQLEFLRLKERVQRGWGTWPFSELPNLRQLVIDYMPSKELSEAIIRASRHSLEHIICTGHIEGFSAISFGTNLRRLSFGIRNMYKRIPFDPTWKMIFEMLSTPAMLRLEEFDLGCQSLRWSLNDLQFEGNNLIWSTLDSILGDRSRCPRLHTFTLFIYRNDSITEGVISTLLKQNLPLFCENGTASAKFVHKFPSYYHIDTDCFLNIYRWRT